MRDYIQAFFESLPFRAFLLVDKDGNPAFMNEFRSLVERLEQAAKMIQAETHHQEEK